MSLKCTEEEYPGYKRRMFECPVCGETMTQWVSVSYFGLGAAGAFNGLPRPKLRSTMQEIEA
jgi:hypothetical protein